MNEVLLIEGTYQIIRAIGSGSGGDVYLAYHTRLEKNVVLKRMKADAQKILDMRAETDILKNLHHPYLPQVFDFVKTTDANGHDAIYTVMDYIPGESFDRLLEQGRRFTSAQVAKYTGQLCEAVAYLHSQKPPIIHGDIKPANVMLTPDDNICLIDFNISGFSDNLDIIAFTRGYASPEQCEAALINGRRKLEERTQDGSLDMTVLTGRQNEAVSDGETELLPGAKRTIDGDETVLLPGAEGTIDDDETVLLPGAGKIADGDETVLLGQRGTVEQYRAVQSPAAIHIDERSDVYSIGATAYSLLLGEMPNPDYKRHVPISSRNLKVSEGLAFVIDKAMMPDPRDRFRSADEMLKALGSLGKKDKRYKRLVLKEIIFCAFFIALASVCAVVSYIGHATMRTERAEAFYGTAEELYEAQNYEQCAEYILDEALADESIYDHVTLGNLYSLAADCNFEVGNYDSAVKLYKSAIRSNPESAGYYCNYAIALSRTGLTDKAAEAVETAVALGLSDDNVDLIRAELYAADGKLSEAESSYRKCISETEDEYTLARAYIMLSELYAGADGYADSAELTKKNVDALNEATERVSESYLPVILERLVGAYGDAAAAGGGEDCIREAVNASKRLISLGWGTFNNYMNLAILYEELEMWDECKETYNTILHDIGENYVVYKNLALMELKIQAELDNGERDYSAFSEYYDKAVELFEASSRQQDSDAEMQLLKESYRAVEDGGWLG